MSWSSAGGIGFKGSRKGTPFAATQAAVNGGNAAKAYGMRSVEVRVKGPGAGRESAIRALQTVGLEVKSIRDVTPIPPQRLPAGEAAARVGRGRRIQESGVRIQDDGGSSRIPNPESRIPEEYREWPDTVLRCVACAGVKA